MEENDYKIINECEFKKSFRKHVLPALETTFPYKRNQLDSCERIREWVEWNYEYSLISRERFRKFEGTTIFAAYFYPFCDNINRYENLIKYMIQFFVFDDHIETSWGDVARNTVEARKLWQQFEQMLEKLISKDFIAINTWKPYVLAMYSVFESIFRDFNEVQKQRCIDCWKNYMQGNLEETECLSTNYDFTDIKQMIAIRIKSIGFRPSVQFIEYADQIYLPEEDWTDPRMDRLFDLIAEIFVYVNDFFSFEKELIQQNGGLSKMFNLVALISVLDNCSVWDSMQTLADMTRSMEKKIRDLESEILNDPDCSEIKRTFIEKMNYLIGANHRVSSVLDRYNKFIQ